MIAKLFILPHRLLLAFLLSACAVTLFAEKQGMPSAGDGRVPLGIRYTRMHPLHIVGDWNSRPYVFINDNGDPDGYLIDIFKELFSMVHVSYDIRLMDSKRAKEEMRAGRADLIIGTDCAFTTAKEKGRKVTVLADNPIAIMHLNTVRNVPSMLLLTPEDTVYVPAMSYPERYINEQFPDTASFHRYNMHPLKALHGILDGDLQFYIWNKNSLTSYVEKLGIQDDVVIEDIDIPSCPLTFYTPDFYLQEELDQQFQRIVRSGRYQTITDKWLLYGGLDNETNAIDIVIIVLLALFFVIIIVSFILMQRGESSGNLKKEFQIITNTGIELSRCQMFAIKMRNHWVYNISKGDFLPDDGMSLADFGELVHPGDQHHITSLHKRLENVHTEIPVMRLRMRKHFTVGDDDWRTVQIHGYVKYNSHKAPVYIYLALIDETDRIEEHTRLDRALREFAYIANISELAMAYYDADGKFVNGNKALYELFDSGGYERAEQYLNRSTVHDMSLVFNGVNFEEDTNMWFCTRIEVQELNLRTTAEVRIQTVNDDRGHFRGHAIGLFCLDDAIRQKNEMHDVKRRIEYLSSELERYQMEIGFILQRNNITTFRWTYGTRYIDISSKLLDYGTRMTFEEYYESVLDEDKRMLRRILDNPEAYAEKPVNEVRCCRGIDDGQPHWYAISIAPDYDEDGSLRGTFGIRCDITSFITAQNELREETIRANDSGRQKALFLANMTHELRTPLNAISGFAELLGVIPDEKEEYVRIMLQNCAMLISIIDNILQLSLIDSEGVRLQQHEVDFARLFPESAAKLSRYIVSREIIYKVDSPMHELKVLIDYENTMRILDAFVSNASKFTSSGSITVGYSSDGSQLSIYCRDTGCGMTQEQQQQIFDRFYKADTFVQGSGLGLSVSKNLADAMGATIDIQSTIGEGSTFTLNIPLG